MEHKEITIKGKKLSYRTSGEGPVIILIHGFGEDGSIWENQYDIFPNHHVIIPDLPGSGQSEIIDDMSMEGLADAIKEIILHETAELYFKEGEPHSVVMIGHSMGGSPGHCKHISVVGVSQFCSDHTSALCIGFHYNSCIA